MIKQVIHDPMLLAMKSAPATKADKQIALDLLDTLKAHRDCCVGMAANMIGAYKCIIVVSTDFGDIAMFNPKITGKDLPYQTEEGCLSLLGDPRKTTRYEFITVEYEDLNFKKHVEKFAGFTAQIIQHEVDHLSGILI